MIKLEHDEGISTVIDMLMPCRAHDNTRTVLRQKGKQKQKLSSSRAVSQSFSVSVSVSLEEVKSESESGIRDEYENRILILIPVTRELFGLRSLRWWLDGWNNSSAMQCNLLCCCCCCCCARAAARDTSTYTVCGGRKIKVPFLIGGRR